MTRNRLRPLARIAAVTVLAIATLPALAALRPFNATYRTSYMGMDGTGNMTLAQAGNRWKFSLVVRAPLGSATQTTVFEEANGTWRPVSGQDTTALLVKHSNKTASYDWGSGQATWGGNVKPDRAGPVRLQAGDVDAMLMDLAIVRDFNAGKPLRYRMVDNGKAKPVSFAVAGKESMTIGGRTVQATKVVNHDGENELALWVSSDYPVPVRIRKTGGDGTMDLRLQSIN